MHKFMLAAVLLLLSVNALVLAGVAYNRWADPVVAIELTERELSIQKSITNSDENSGTSLKMKWQVFNPDEYSDNGYSYYNTPVWLDHKKLTGLGFDIKALVESTKYRRYKIDTTSNEVILVLEYQGQTYRKALQAAEKRLSDIQDNILSNPEDTELPKTLTRHENKLRQLKISGSRLYVIDAGLDLQALIKQYPEQGRYIFARGEISLSWDDDVIKGRIRQLLIDSLHVPLPMSARLSQLSPVSASNKAGGDFEPPRYQVKLNYGPRLEPWVVTVVYTRD